MSLNLTSLFMRIPNPKFQVFFKAASNLYHFQLRAANGRVVITSAGHQSKLSCIAAIALCRELSQSENAFSTKYAEGRYTFSMLDTNDVQICSSRLYSTIHARDHGIESVKINVPLAAVEDVTGTMTI